MAVNNAAAVVRPQLWCAVDTPRKFIEHIWLDPAVTKFIPIQHFSQRPVRTPKSLQAQTLGELPSVYGYRRNAEFHANRFLTESTFSWGCSSRVKDDAGVSGTRTVFLVALKLLYFLGVRTVYLVGCDWRMTADRPYAFLQRKDRNSVARNNNLYRVTGQRLGRLKPHFDKAGFQVFNTTAESHLEVFPRIEFPEAMDRATAHIPSTINTEGRY